MRHARRTKDKAPSVEPITEPQGQQRALFSARLVRPLFLNPQNTMFHSKNGLFFVRLNDTGEVRILKTRDGKMPDPDTNPPACFNPPIRDVGAA